MKTSKNVTRQELADFKRLMECCIANPAWRREFLAGPEEWLSERGLRLDSALAVDAFAQRGGGEAPDNPYLRGLQEILDRIHEDIGEKVKPERMPDQAFLNWYQRRSKGYYFTSARSRATPGFYHVPFSFELTEGCSVGCSFCCFAAGRLKQVFRYTEENAGLWREVLEISQALAGDMTGMGICYMATEPFDNPDYELFLGDFQRILGRYPQTTTALAHRYVDRIKNFMGELGEEALSLAAMRFSVTSLEQLQTIHQSYTAQELLFVELLMNNPESAMAYGRSGRAVELSESLKDKRFSDSASCACNCGFVVNLPEHTVTLVSPHRPDAKHPLGMTIYETRRFAGAKEYRETLEGMIREWMPKGLPTDRPLTLADGVTCRRRGYTLTLRGDGIARSLSLGEKEHGWWERLMKEGISLEKLYRSEDIREFERRQLERKLGILYEGGCIEEGRL